MVIFLQCIICKQKQNSGFLYITTTFNFLSPRRLNIEESRFPFSFFYFVFCNVVIIVFVTVVDELVRDILTAATMRAEMPYSHQTSNQLNAPNMSLVIICNVSPTFLRNV